MSNLSVPYNDLKPLHEELRPKLDAAYARVMDSGHFILGKELEALEGDLASQNNYVRAVGVANGTDALELALKSYRFLTRFDLLKQKKHVLTVANSAPATVCAIVRAGFVPRFVDVNHMGQMDTDKLADASWEDVFAVVPVMLYGDKPNFEKIKKLSEEHGVFVIADCAQSYGTVPEGLDAATLSFYPTKNVGAIGDAGAVLTNDLMQPYVLKAMRFYGIYESDKPKLQQRMIGQNSRLDELQAAFLRVKLEHFQKYMLDRLASVMCYMKNLPKEILPWMSAGNFCRHILNVRVERRNMIQEYLRVNGIATLIHYPTPAHEQIPTEQLIDLPETEKWCKETLSLPLYYGMGVEKIEYVCKVLRNGL